MRARRVLSLFIGAAIVIAAGIASAQPPPPPPPPAGGATGPVAADRVGPFLRAHIGLSIFRASASDDFDELTISGVGPGLGIAGGFAVQPNLFLHGELFYEVAFDPDVEINGETMSTEDASAGMVGIGAGATYYIMPSNIYFSGTLAMTQVVLDADGETEGSEWGPGVSLMAGKEWLVGPKAGVGLAGRLSLGSQKVDPDFDVDWTTTVFSLLFSATYN